MTQLRIEPYTIPAADLGPENPLPVFRGSNPDSGVAAESAIPEEDRRYLGWGTAYRVLPYRMQDSYNRDKRPRAFQAAVLENEILRATFLPEVGGKLWSLVHKPSGRELLERNPVFQPANLALRNAWTGGGIEWNCPQLGHHYLTCSPVFAARVAGSQGEAVLRIYEWDRVKCVPWQIDFHLPPGSPFLFSRVRLCNTHEAEIPMYWWTNIAVPEKPGHRTLVPAETAICGALEGLRHVRMPLMPFTAGGTTVQPGGTPAARASQAGEAPVQQETLDVSYPTQLPSSGSIFFSIAEPQRRWIASLDETGRGLVHASTGRMRGRKMFFWGMSQGGRRWQEYLAQPGSNYIEIQAGLARTQDECVPMPGGTQWTWTEAFGLLEADVAKVHSADWSQAWRAADAALGVCLPQEQLDARDREFEAVTSRPPDEILAHGSGWGALERRRLEAQKQPDLIPSELVFVNLGADQEPWLALLEHGALPALDPAHDPGQWMVQPEWRGLLERSLASEGRRAGDWLAWLHLGVMRMENLDRGSARAAWEKSVQLRRNSWALRNLAVLETSGELDRRFVWPPQPRSMSLESLLRACELMRQAWECGPSTVPLAIEYARLLLDAGRYESLREFTRALPAEILQNERIRLLAARAALEAGQWAELEPLFSQEFASIREGEVALTDLWFGYQERRLAAAEHVPLDAALRQRVRREFPPPRNIDFRMSWETD